MDVSSLFGYDVSGISYTFFFMAVVKSVDTLMLSNRGYLCYIAFLKACSYVGSCKSKIRGKEKKKRLWICKRVRHILEQQKKSSHTNYYKRTTERNDNKIEWFCQSI
ncbi:unnamed protein product [Rhizopus stolonifer]